VDRRGSAVPGPTSPTLIAGARAYGQALGVAGGRQLEAMGRSHDRQGLYVGLYASPPYDLRLPALEVARLSINLSSSPVFGGLADEKVRRYEARRLTLHLTPAQAATRWRKTEPSRHLNLYFDPEPFGPAAQRPLWNTTLPGAGALIGALEAEFTRDDPFAAEAVDGLARLLLVRLLRRERAAGSAVTAVQVARLRDHVQAHLADRLLVKDLAAVLGLPAHRFTQDFVRCTGHSPHQFVLAQRVHRAVALLRHSRLPLAEVAVACGFASQQHMTHVVRRWTGSTPGVLRTGESPLRRSRSIDPA
jgi:AraC-like DNA-binding protein